VPRGPDARVAAGPPPLAAVEQRGIEHVPADARWGRPGGLFWMWAGAVWNVEFVVYGGLAIIIGLSFAQAVLVILIGNLSYVLTGLASLPGPRAGTTTFAISRAPFGPRGNQAPSFFNWVTQVGFEIEGIALIVLAAIAITARAGFVAGGLAKVIFIVAAIALQAVLPLLGHAAVLRVLKWLAVPFIVLFAVMAALTASKVRLHAVPHGAGWGALTIVLALVIAAGGLGWAENASDYSRYLPPDASRRRIVAAVALGGAVPSALLEILGAAVATGVPALAATGSAGAVSISGLPSAFPAWFVVPYLVFAIVQLFAINTLDLYSSGVTLQSLFPRLRRIHCVAVDTVVCGALATYAVFSSRFSTLLYDFLLLIIVWLGPWCAIFLVDAGLRRGRYDGLALLGGRESRYFRDPGGADGAGSPGPGGRWRRGGFHWPAIIAQAAGMVAAALWLDAAPPYVGPLASRIGAPAGSDFSVFLGLAVAGLTYWLLARRSVPAEAAASPAPASAAR
jgi:nucleobase:cation symporter-1, NCS1 family